MVLALAGAEVAFEAPERRDHRCRYAEFLFLAIEQRPVLLDLVGATWQASARQHLVGHLQEGLREEALPPVDVDDALVEHKVRRRSVDRLLRDALCPRLALEVGEPAAEVGGVAAVGLGQGRRARHECRHDR